ncbi:MAG: hypothetical protein M1835_006748 [Candelina submexicana]|nr:MAG: hypothetical protein M1835_006748 [Candelina submexicana]
MNDINNTAEDISNAARGHRANISNSKTSNESKANSQKILDQMPDNPHYGDEDQNKSKNPNQVAGGLKAAINNPNVTEQGKKEAQKKLDAL